MGIQKSVLMKNGVTATFWKITKIIVNVEHLVTYLTIAPFLNSAKANDGASHVGPSKVFIFNITDDQVQTNRLEDGYNAILYKASTMVKNSDGDDVFFDEDLAGGQLI